MRRTVVASAICGAGVSWLLALSPVLAASQNPSSGAHHLLPGQLNFLADPTLAFGLLLLALLGVGLELLHPGAVVPGTVGLIAGILAFGGLLDLPLNLVGLALLAGAVALFVIDISAPTHGVLSLGGVTAAAGGGWLLFRSPGVDPVALVALPVILGAGWLWLSSRALQVRRRPYPAVPQELLGRAAQVVRSDSAEAAVSIDGELWRAIERDGVPLEVGSEVEVLAQDGLTLIVRMSAPPRNRGELPAGMAGPANADGR